MKGDVWMTLLPKCKVAPTKYRSGLVSDVLWWNFVMLRGLLKRVAITIPWLQLGHPRSQHHNTAITAPQLEWHYDRRRYVFGCDKRYKIYGQCMRWNAFDKGLLLTSNLSACFLLFDFLGKFQHQNEKIKVTMGQNKITYHGYATGEV